VLYDAARHEPLTETLWDEGRVRESIAAIVDDAEGSGVDAGWPNHPLDDDQEDEPLLDSLTTIYLGAAGMLWALHALGSSLDLPALAEVALGRYRARPDWGESVEPLDGRVRDPARRDARRLRGASRALARADRRERA
jgi:hypothetical protein